VIAAAGSGQRLGAGGPKAFVELRGRPMLEWSLDAFRAAASIAAIVVAVPAGSEGAVGEGATAVAGGPTRADSVAAGLALVETELVAVHDAARPLVTPELVDALVAELLARPDADGVIAAVPIADTVKRGGPEVSETLDRDGLWAAQTPQVFRTAALRAAYERAGRRAGEATDEAMLVEWLGGRVLLHAASPANVKVTTEADLRLAELLLAGRG